MPADPLHACVSLVVCAVVAGAAGCERPDARPRAPRLTSAPVLTTPADVPLARELVVKTDRPARLTVTVDDGAHATEVRFAPLATEHVVPVLGMGPDRDVTVTVVVASEDGAERRRELPTFHTEPLPPDFPHIDVLALDPDRVEPGFRLLPLSTPGGPSWLAALRADDGEVAWLYTGVINFGDVRMTADATLLGVWGGGWEIDLLGRVVRHWAGSDRGDPDAIPLSWTDTLTHELYPLPDGTFLSLVSDTFRTDAYPESYEDPTPTRRARLEEQRVVRFDASGALLADWPLSARLDPSRIGFGSLRIEGHGLDWTHANAVVPCGDDGSLLLSVRHQDALVKLDPDGEVEWILADPAGWRPPWSERLLAPAPGLTWAYHQHGPSLDDEGRIVVFDNHNFGYTPYGPPPEDGVQTRVVAFRVDEEARTVTQEWSWSSPDSLVSSALGNAQHLPLTGNVLAAFGFLDGERDLVNGDLGYGRKSVRLIELAPDEPDPISDLRLWTRVEEVPQGVKLYRSFAAPSLYPDGVAVETRDSTAETDAAE